MPSGGGGHQDRLVRIQGQGAIHLGLGFENGLRLDALAFAVEEIEFGGDAVRLGLIGAGEKGGTEPRMADAPTGIDARTEEIAEVPGFRWLAQGCRIEQGGEADPTPAAHYFQSLDDEGAVEAGQWHHVGHRRQRHQIQGFGEIGQIIPPSPPQAAVESHESEEDDPRRAEVAQARHIVETVGIHQGAHRGQDLRCAVMIEDDHIEAELGRGCEGLVAARAAIDADEELCPALRQRRDRRHVGAVPFRDPVRNVDVHRQAERT